MKRILFFVIGIGLILWVHPIAAMIFALIIGIQTSYTYYEMIVFGFLIDVVYNSIIPFRNFQIPMYTAIAVMLFLSLSAIKKRLSFHA